MYVLDQRVKGNENRHASSNGDDVVYIAGTITDAALVSSVLSRTRPRVILHAASPVASLPRARWHEFEAINVTGTRILLFAASTPETSTVKALVYTSSPDIYANPPHHNVTETHPLVPDDSQHNGSVSEYVRTKATAHRLVLAVNSPSLRTCAPCCQPSCTASAPRKGLSEILSPLRRPRRASLLPLLGR